MRVLVIDDEPFVLKLLARQLHNLGFDEVILHERGRDALQLLENGAAAVDLIFCDLQMPEMDGVEMIRHLVRIGYSGKLVLVSGEDKRVLQTAEKLAKGHRLQVLGAVHKPVSYEKLRQMLNAKLSGAAKAPRSACRSYACDELRQAIARGELENHYQPKVELASGVIAGVETLVRWRHPQDGLLFPDRFIGMAEEHGLIDELTRAVLIAALRQARLWQDAGLRLDVAVNVSMDNLAALEFPDFVVREADVAGVPLCSLVLEVTESRLMKDPLAALDIFTRLRLKRIGLSIDDFGTGHSSLAQLRDIPFDELKVDRGFVHGACRDASLKAIFEASLSMAQQLSMNTVAEGVEDQDDWDFARAAGCELAQGYFIARPMPAAELVGWIAAWERRRCALKASAA
ncbi:MAG TPA: EAL domain-containing response regulator [Terriglobales bacterium]|nr:EAL domain-containing response regulator [Terriglobales bacterium]